LVALLYLTGALDFVERHLHDFRSGLLSRRASGEIVLVTVDRQSLQRQPGWPWPREYHAIVLERLIDAGATKVPSRLISARPQTSRTIDD
jgi:CHASE2 domain-containing sensor protein